MDPRHMHSDTTGGQSNIVAARRLRAIEIERHALERSPAFDSLAAFVVANPIDAGQVEGYYVHASRLAAHHARNIHNINPLSGWENYMRAYGPQSFSEHRLGGNWPIVPEPVNHVNLPSLEEYNLLAKHSVLPFETNALDTVTTHYGVNNLSNDPDPTGPGPDVAEENIEEEEDGVIHFDWHTLWPTQDKWKQSRTTQFKQLMQFGVIALSLFFFQHGI